MTDVRMQLRRDTAANWTSSNPTLADGEPGYETDTGRLKIGDGTTAWTSLDYSFDVQGIIDSAPAALDTLNELAAAIADDADFHTTVLVKSNNLSGLSDAAAARANLDLEPGVDVLGYDSNLASAVSAYDFPTADGSSGQAVKTNGSGTLSFTDLPVPGGSFTATASGSISDGDPCVVNSDGTVSAVALIPDWSSIKNVTTAAPVSGYGSETVPERYYVDIEYNPDNNEYAITYVMRNSTTLLYQLHVYFVTVNSGVPSFTGPIDTGVAVGINSDFRISTLYVGNNTYVFHSLSASGDLLAYAFYNNAGTPVIGSPTTVATGLTSDVTSRAVHYVDDGKYLIWFSNVANVVQCHCLTVSGTTITDESNVTFSGGAPFGDSNDGASGYCTQSNGYYFFLATKKAVNDSIVYMAATVSGTTVSVATAPTTAAFPSGSVFGSLPMHSQALSDGTIICIASDGGSYIYANAFAATTSGGTLTLGAPVTMESTLYTSTSYNIAKFLIDGGPGNQHGLYFGYKGNRKGKVVRFSVSASTITKIGESDVTTEVGDDYDIYSIAGAPTNGEYIGIWHNASPIGLSWFKVSVNIQKTLTVNNYVGISAGNYADSSTATIQTVGSIDDARTGLTPGEVYYVQPNGSFATTSVYPPVLAGLAVSSTKLLIQDNIDEVLNAAETPDEIGAPFGGGFYAGKINDDGTEYYLIIAPKSSGESTKQWKTSQTTTAGTDSVIDGPTNSSNMNDADHPAAQFCEGLTIGGFSDWYMPAKNELEVCYYNLKPTTTSNDTSSGTNTNAVPSRGSNYTAGTPAQTSLFDFQTGGTEALAAAYYWSSTEYSGTQGWMQYFVNGGQSERNKDSTEYVRAVRRVAV